jgi:hypothetical protein
VSKVSVKGTRASRRASSGISVTAVAPWRASSARCAASARARFLDSAPPAAGPGASPLAMWQAVRPHSIEPCGDHLRGGRRRRGSGVQRSAAALGRTRPRRRAKGRRKPGGGVDRALDVHVMRRRARRRPRSRRGAGAAEGRSYLLNSSL